MRPEEQARRAAQKAAARGEEPEAPPQSQLNVLEQRVYHAFFIGGVGGQPDGSKVLTFITPDGRAHVWPIGGEQAKEIGQALIAPSVHVAGAHEMPPTNGHDPGGAA